MAREDEVETVANPLTIEIERGQQAIPCKCGGYCDLVDSTADECLEYGCGRDRSGNQCCAVSFVCRICQQRYAGNQPAPDW